MNYIDQWNSNMMKGSLMDHSNSHANNNNNNAEASGGGVNEENSQTLLNMNHVRGGATSCDSDNSLYSSMDKIMNMGGGGAGQSMTNMPKMSGGGGNGMCKPEKDMHDNNNNNNNSVPKLEDFLGGASSLSGSRSATVPRPPAHNDASSDSRDPSNINAAHTSSVFNENLDRIYNNNNNNNSGLMSSSSYSNNGTGTGINDRDSFKNMLFASAMKSNAGSAYGMAVGSVGTERAHESRGP